MVLKYNSEEISKTIFIRDNPVNKKKEVEPPFFTIILYDY